jgi:hypothetical protein
MGTPLLQLLLPDFVHDDLLIWELSLIFEREDRTSGNSFTLFNKTVTPQNVTADFTPNASFATGNALDGTCSHK